MSNPEKISLHGRRLLDRRGFLGTAGLSASGLALASMLSNDGLLADDKPQTVSGKVPIRPVIDPNNRTQVASRISMSRQSRSW